MKILAITLGDINGIGPEVALKAVYSRRWPADTRFVLVGDSRVLEPQAAALGLPVPPAWERVRTYRKLSHPRISSSERGK